MRLSLFARRPVIVNLWASWCGGCITEAPVLSRFVRAHPPVAVLGINTMDARAPARAFTRRHRLTFPNIFDPHARLFARLGSPGLPMTLFLDRRHRIVLGVPGALTRSQLEAGLRAARGAS
jgi:cytochrome c biogenesis protein CcmG/thiol:disulfide interchange protein DsbE